MRRVYTDERFPGSEIVNNGSGTFEVYYNGALMQTFESWENPDGTVSEQFAARRARDYFDRMARMDMTGEHEEQMLDASADAMEKRDHTEIFNASERKPSSTEIDNLMAQEKIEQDPVKKAELRQHILNLMKQEESVAEAVVNHLLGL